MVSCCVATCDVTWRKNPTNATFHRFAIRKSANILIGTRKSFMSRMVKLTPEQVQFYKDNGYIKLSGLFTDEEMDAVCEEYDRLFFIKNNDDMETSWLGSAMNKATNGKNYSVHAIHNLQYHSFIFSRLLHNENLLDALESVMGTEDILLHHNKAHFKPPKVGAPYLMHQDYHYFPYKKDSMVAAFVHIDKADPENGGLCIYPGSHKLGPLENFGTVENGVAYHYMNPAEYPIDKATPVVAERGDVVLFSYLTLHGSYSNLSARPRRMFLVQVMAADDEPLADVHKSHGMGWLLREKNDYRKATMAERFLH